MIYFLGTFPISSPISILNFYTIIEFKNTKFFQNIILYYKDVNLLFLLQKTFSISFIGGLEGKSIHHFLVVSLNQTISVSFPSNITHTYIFRFYNKKIYMSSIWFYKHQYFILWPQGIHEDSYFADIYLEKTKITFQTFKLDKLVKYDNELSRCTLMLYVLSKYNSKSVF